MEIEPHPDNPKKALVIPEDLMEASLLKSSIPFHRSSLDYLNVYKSLMFASIELLNNRRPDPMTLRKRQLKFIGQRLINQELPHQFLQHPENVHKVHNMAEQIFDYLGIRLGKGG